MRHVSQPWHQRWLTLKMADLPGLLVGTTLDSFALLEISQSVESVCIASQQFPWQSFSIAAVLEKNNSEWENSHHRSDAS